MSVQRVLAVAGSVGTNLALSMPMWLQALLTVKDIEAALAEVTPLRLALDEESPDRYFWLAPPRSVTFLANRGIRVETSAKLQWDVVGVSVPITILSAVVVLKPFVRREDDQDVLYFEAEIDKLDLSNVPALVEGPIVSALNGRLGKEASLIKWKFMETLDFDFEMPASVAPLEKLRLYARSGSVRVGEEALELGVDLDLKGTTKAGSQGMSEAELLGAESQTAALLPSA